MTDRYLVTGAMGCIGAWALHHLVRRGAPVVSFDLADDRHRLDLLLSRDEQREAITFVHGDLTDAAQVHAVVADHGITRIVHLAALQVPFCRADPRLGAAVNVVGTVNVFEAARANDIAHLTYASSVAVFGPDTPVGADGLASPDAPRNPATFYGVYKVANEDTAQVYWTDHGISSLALRPYTVYGVGRDQGMTSEPTKAIAAVVRGEPFHVSVSGPQQFQLASDVAHQFLDAADQVDIGRAAVVSLATPVATVRQFLDHLRALRPDAQITEGDTPLPFPPGFDDAALRATVPVVHETPLAEGIAQTLEHLSRTA